MARKKPAAARKATTSQPDNALPAHERIAYVGVLGPVFCWNSSGGPVWVTPGQQRVLVTLLQSANSFVSGDTLRDEFWPDSELAANNLQTAVWNLRRVLARQDSDGATPSVESRHGGYELRIDRFQCDLFRHLRLRDAAARAATRGEHAHAKSYLQGALRLWRGEALVELRSDNIIMGFATYLEELRTEATRGLIEACLALGESQEQIPWLLHLANRYPFDENLVRLLMVALFHSGRQRDALAAYEKCRHALFEAGMNPTKQLRDTHEYILNHDARVLARPAAAAKGGHRPAIAGTVLVGRWQPFEPPTWAFGDAEVALLADDDGGELIAPDARSLVARFDDVGAAMAAAVAMQEALKARQGPLGRFLVFDGAQVPVRGARLLRLCQELLDQAGPGQILLVSPLKESGDRRPPPGTVLHPAGERPLRAGKVLHLFQLMTPALVEDAPPFAPPEPPPSNNLEPPDEPVVGRAALVEEVAEKLSRHRLVTLTGIGGVGKTRVAVEVASRLLGEYREGCWLIELEWLKDGGLVESTVAEKLGLTGSRPSAPSDLLVRALSNRHVLLVLDTCEHLLAPIRGFVDRVVAACPQVSVLATSLQPLGSAHECALAVPPLAVAREGPDQPVVELRELSSVQLFQQYLGDDPASDEDVPLIAEICRMVDGIPLAIALAAARTQQLGLAALAGELGRSLDQGGTLRLLDEGGKLAGTLEWSFSLLDEAERRLLSHLSLFAGTFTLDDAKELLEGLPGGETASTLCRLVNWSAIVVAAEGRAAPRYRLLPPVRDFASGKLAADAHEKAVLSRRHADLYLRRAEAADRHFGEAGEDAFLAGLDESIGNLRSAFSWAVSAGEAAISLAFGGALWRFWFARGHLDEGYRSLRQALALAPSPSPSPSRERIRALGGSSYLAWWMGNLDYTRTSAEETIVQAEAADDPWGRAWGPLGLVASWMFFPDRPRPSIDLTSSLAYFVGSDLTWEASQTLQLMAGELWHRGDYPAAEKAYGRVLELNRTAGSQTYLDALQAHGLMRALQGSLPEGRGEVEEGLQIAARRNDRVGISHALAYRAAIARYDADFEESARLYTLALRMADDIGDVWIVLWALDGLAAWAAPTRPATAAQLLGFVEALTDKTKIQPAPKERADHDAATDEVVARLGASAAKRALSRGRGLSPLAAVKLALELGA